MVLILEKLKCGPKPKKCCNCTTFSTLKIFILPHMEIYYYINSYLYMQIRAQISSAGGGQQSWACPPYLSGWTCLEKSLGEQGAPDWGMSHSPKLTILTIY